MYQTAYLFSWWSMHARARKRQKRASLMKLITVFVLFFAYFCFCSNFLLSFACLWVYLGLLVVDFGFGSGEVSSLVLCSVRRFLHVVEVFWLILLWYVLVSVWFNLIFGSFSAWTLFSASTSFSTSTLFSASTSFSAST